MPTPGLPEIDDEASDETVMTSYNYFRRQTLLRYLDETLNHSPELKAKILDWKPQVLESKTRHQTSQARAVTAYKDIFGIDLPGTKRQKGPGKKTSSKKKQQPVVDTPMKTDTVVVPPIAPAMAVAGGLSTPPEVSAAGTEKPKKTPRKSKKVLALEAKAAAVDEVDDNYVATETEEKLQTELQTYALDLLETNTSWEKRTVIQNLVIWEPVTDPALLAIPSNIPVPGTVPGLALPPVVASGNLKQPASGQLLPPLKGVRRKAKKVRKRQSGLDFSRKKAPSSSGKRSRDVSRPPSPSTTDTTDQGTDEVWEIVHTLDHVLTDSKHMVMDKSAGETILHRASKMGYPDVAAYALDMAKLSATIKDNAGFPPIHKAALKGHAEIVDYLIRYIRSLAT
jgi:hypothetical protein